MQYVIYLFQCDLCDANNVGYTARHLHQRIFEHRYSAIGKHLETQQGNNRTKTDHLSKVLRKFNSKFDCLVYEMLYIKDIKPSPFAPNCLGDTFLHFIISFYYFLCFLPWELYPQDPHIFYVFCQILYIHLTQLTFSLFNLIMA